LFVAFSVSPYVVALGWLGGRLDSAMAGWMLGRPAAVSWVLGSALAPLAALLVYAGARRESLSAEEAGVLAASPRDVARGIVLRRLAPVFYLAAVVIFAIGFSDYSVASLFQVPTYPVEVFLYYAGAFQPAHAARACLPLVVCGLALALALAGPLPGLWLRRQAPTPARHWPLTPGARRTASATLLVLPVVLVAPPWLRHLRAVGDAEAAGRAVLGGTEALLNSLALSLLAAGLAVLLGWAASPRLTQGPRWWRALLAAALLLPLFVPASAFGIAWIELRSWSGLPLPALQLLDPALCLGARFGGLAALYLAGVRLTLVAEPLEAARLQEASGLRRWLRIERPLLLPAALAAAGILVALNLNATGILVLTAPPGFEVLPLRVDNLLHYGLPEEASALALATAVAAALPVIVGLAAHRALRRRSRPC
jgi:ABC-type Fe3+ transport system permease subunit